MSISEKTVTDSYYEVVSKNGLIPLKEQLDDRQSAVKKQKVQNVLRSRSLWNDTSNGGHLQFKNKVSNVTVGMQGHNGSDVPLKQAKTISDGFETHMEFLATKIFDKKDIFKEDEKKRELPDFKAAAKRYNTLRDLDDEKNGKIIKKKKV